MSLLLLAAAAATIAQVTSVQLPNPEIFGKSTGDAVTLLLEKKPGEAEPYVVWSDVRCGRYFAASAFYWPPVTKDIVRATVRTVYGNEWVPPGQATPMDGLWRLEDRRFSIQIAEEKERGEGVVRVTYIHFHEGLVAKVALEAHGVKKSDLDRAFGSDPCVDFGNIETKK
jgi:hypothetical protein